MRYYKLALEKEPKILINYLVKEIKLFDDKIIITYNTPNNSLDDGQDYVFIIAIFHAQFMCRMLINQE